MTATAGAKVLEDIRAYWNQLVEDSGTKRPGKSSQAPATSPRPETSVRRGRPSPRTAQPIGEA